MKRTCRISARTFEVSQEELALLERLSPVINGRRYPLPAPDVCPDERKRLRLAFRNERNLFRRRCDATGAQIFSAYSPDKPWKVYSREAWWGDGWDERGFGREFDFSRPFFPQFAELKKSVPQLTLVSTPEVEENNSTYVNFCGHSRNCYMTFDSDFNEDSCYANVLKHSRYCLDCSYVQDSELCYECVDCSSCYALSFSQDCVNCSNSAFLRGCIGCSDCLLCTNLVKKQYCIENRSCTKAEYLRLRREFDLGTAAGIRALRERFQAFHLAYPKKYCRIMKAENCSGDYILNAKNCRCCFNIADCEDMWHCDALYGAKDCMDVSSFGEKIERVYNSGTIGVDAVNIWMSYVVVANCSDLIYCDNCRQSRSSFGCCSLRRREYCILNKQYSRDEYNALAPRIIEHMTRTGEWGAYFPISLSPFGYNETMAGEHFPLRREEAQALVAAWSDYQPPAPDVPAAAPEDLPERIAEAGDDVLSKAIRCEATGRAFRMTRAELDSYRKKGLPLPRRHPDQRYRDRMKQRNPQRLWERRCAKTGRSLLTSYSPDGPEIIYCEEAYQEALE